MGLFGSADKKKKQASTRVPVSKKAKPVRVSDYLSERSVQFFPAGIAKEEVFKQLLQSLDLPDPAAALQMVLEREVAGATVIAPGLAIPHARLAGIPHVMAAVGICPAGVAHSAEEQPSQVFFLFLSPKENMQEHLMFLAGISALFQVEGLIETLVKQQTPAGVLQAIREAEGVSA